MPITPGEAGHSHRFNSGEMGGIDHKKLFMKFDGSVKLGLDFHWTMERNTSSSKYRDYDLFTCFIIIFKLVSGLWNYSLQFVTRLLKGLKVRINRI